MPWQLPPTALAIGTTGLVLRWALVTGSTIHASLRDQTTGFFEWGGGYYLWTCPLSIPDGYAGAVLFYVGTIALLTTRIGMRDFGLQEEINAKAATTGGVLVLGTNTGTLTITAGIIVTQSNPDTPGVSISGNGTGAGMLVTGGDTGHGLQAAGGATSGNAIHAAATQNGHGFSATGNQGGFHGIHAVGGDTGNGHGIFAGSGGGGTANGFHAQSSGDNGHGVFGQGAGTGDGINGQGVLTGHGIHGVGGFLGGSGIRAEATASGQNGATFLGVGTGIGFFAQGGSTGLGAKFVGGATSGAAFSLTTTSGTGAFLINGTANVAQTGDSFAVVNSGTFGNALLARTTITATIANQTTILNAVNAITTNTARSAPRIPDFMARPSSGSVANTGDMYLYNLQGQLEDADGNTVTVHARNAVGTSLDAGLSSTTMTRISIGWYRMTYTVASTDTAQAVYFDFSWAVNSAAMKDGAATQVQDAENYASLVAIKAQTDKISTNSADSPNAVTAQGGISTLAARLTSTRAGNLDFLDASILSRMATFVYTTPPTTAAIASAVLTGTGDNTTPGSLGYLVAQNLDAKSSAIAAAVATAISQTTASALGTAVWVTSATRTLTGTVTIGGYATGQDPATLVLDALTSAHTVAGSFGLYLGTTLPGSLANGATIVLTPFQVTVQQPRIATKDFEVGQGEQVTYTFIAVDADGNAVNLSGKTLTFVTWTTSGITLTKVFAYTTANHIAVGGTSHNQVAVQFQSADLAAATVYSYALVDTTDGPYRLLEGRLSVKPGLLA